MKKAAKKKATKKVSKVSKVSPKLVIHLSGGNIQDCYCNFGNTKINLDFVLIDEDNLDAEGYTEKQMSELVDIETEGLVSIYPDCPTPENGPEQEVL